MKTDWLPIERVDYNSEIRQVHCDTRDFGTYTDTEVYQDLPDMRTILNSNYEKRFIYTLSEIKGLLLDLKERSGGNKKWRLLTFIGMEKNQLYGWDLKYIRFYWTQHGWVCFARNGGKDGRFVNKSVFELPIDKEVLGEH